VTAARDTLRRIDVAVERFDQALEAVRQIPKRDLDGVKVGGIEHELLAVAERLRSLRDEAAGKGDGGE
jgi:hypothetical protein